MASEIEAGLNFHDIAALIPITENAGGVVSDWQGNPFDGSGQILATANPSLQKDALNYLN